MKQITIAFTLLLFFTSMAQKKQPLSLFKFSNTSFTDFRLKNFRKVNPKHQEIYTKLGLKTIVEKRERKAKVLSEKTRVFNKNGFEIKNSEGKYTTLNTLDTNNLLLQQLVTKKGKQSYKVIQRFNKDKQLTEKITFVKGKQASYLRYAYNNEGLTTSNLYAFKGKITSRKFFYYNQSKQLITETSFNKEAFLRDSISYQWANGKLLQEQKFSGKNRTLQYLKSYRCDDNGKIEKQDAQFCTYKEEANDGSYKVYWRSTYAENNYLNITSFSKDSLAIKVEGYKDGEDDPDYLREIKGNQILTKRIKIHGKKVYTYLNVDTYNDDLQIVKKERKTFKNKKLIVDETTNLSYYKNGLIKSKEYGQGTTVSYFYTFY